MCDGCLDGMYKCRVYACTCSSLPKSPCCDCRGHGTLDTTILTIALAIQEEFREVVAHNLGGNEVLRVRVSGEQFYDSDVRQLILDNIHVSTQAVGLVCLSGERLLPSMRL